MIYIFGWDIYFVSIEAGAQVTINLLAFGPCVVIVNLLGQVCTLGRAPRTKKTLPDFREWCRVTRHLRVFRGLTGCQRIPRFWGVTAWYQSLGKRLPCELVGCSYKFSPDTSFIAWYQSLGTRVPRAWGSWA